MNNVMLVVGARPQFIKCAPVVKEILARHRRINLSIVHSGQHYDPQMSAIFFRDLQIPQPISNLNVGSGSHAVQTATIMKRLETSMLTIRPRLVVVPGDTNTTLGAALTAAKLHIPVAHMEAGMRSGDMAMPEEINRRLTDHCSSLLFAPTMTAVRNLKSEGLSEQTRLTGDTMVDTLIAVLPEVRRRQASVLDELGLQPDDYMLVTLHRPSNVDDPQRLGELLKALGKLTRRLRVVFSVHPRTRARVSKLKTSRKNSATMIPPQGYVETLALLKNARCLLTDSGGMQKESFLLHVPCVTLRSTTEWPETLVGGANRLVMEPSMLPRVVFQVAFNDALKQRIQKLKSPFGDGHASARVSTLIEETVMR